jgi:hypothetical protein
MSALKMWTYLRDVCVTITANIPLLLTELYQDLAISVEGASVHLHYSVWYTALERRSPQLYHGIRVTPFWEVHLQ